MKKILKRIIIVLIVAFIISIILIYYYNKKIAPTLMKYAKIESKKIAIDIISKDVSNDISEYLDHNSMFYTEKDNSGNVEIVDYNTKTVNEVLSVASKRVMKNFDDIKIKNNGIVTYLPLGIVTNNVFFENLGPKVPIKIALDGNVLTSLKTDVKEYGINSALIIIYIKIEANVDIILPLKTNTIKVINEVPISIKITKGNVSSILNSE